MRRRTGSGRALSRRCQGFLDQRRFDCFACIDKANTHGTAEATGVVIEAVSTMAAGIIDDRALATSVCNYRRSIRLKARSPG
jgi:hypothetical protein